MSALHFTKENFDADVLGSDKVTMVDFWAPWCVPCQMLGPVIEELAEQATDNQAVGKINIDEEPDLAVRYGVMTIPTVIIFKDGKEAARSVGVKSKFDLSKLLENA